MTVKRDLVLDAMLRRGLLANEDEQDALTEAGANSAAFARAAATG
jgi:hypothetical protein